MKKFYFILSLMLIGTLSSFGQTTLDSRATGNWSAVDTWISPSLTGTITTTVISTTVTGVGTSFTTQLQIGAVLYRTDGTTLIGTVQSITNATTLILTAVAANANAGANFRTRKIPAALDNVTISNTHTVTLIDDRTCASLTVGNGLSGVFNSTAGDDLTTGNLTINTGAVFQPTGDNALFVSGNLVNNGTFNANNGGNDMAVTFNGTNQSISGTGTFTFDLLTFANTGTATLGVSLLSVADILNVNAGTILDLSTFSIGATGLDLESGSTTTAASIIGTGSIILAGDVTTTDVAGAGTIAAIISAPITLGATRTFTVASDGVAGADLTISGVISGAFGIIKAGAGQMNLSGLNTYTGITQIAAGTLSINTLKDVSGGASSLGAPVTAVNGTISMSGGTTGLQYTGAGTSSNRAIATGGAGPTIDASGSGTLTLTGALTGNDNITFTGTTTGVYNGAIGTAGSGGSFTKNGTGTWTLGGANTFDGTTTIAAGVLSVGTIGDGGTTGNLGEANAITLTGGRLRYTGATASTNRTVALTGNANIIDVSTLGVSLTITGITSGVLGGYTKAGVGTLVMGGVNTYTGVTTIGGGVLSVATIGLGGASGNLGAAAIAAGNIVIDTGTLRYTGVSATTNRGFTITGTLAPFTTVDISTGGQTLTVTGAVASTCTRFIKAGLGTLSRTTSAATFTGDFVLAAGAFTSDQTTSVAGNWENNGGTYTGSGTATVVFNGTSAQTIGGTAATTFNALQINNAAGVSLTTVDASVTTLLTLTAGNLTIPTGRLLTITSGTAIAGSPFSAAKSIVTQSNSGTGAQGFVRVNILQGAVYTIPTSDGTNYLPVILTPTELLTTNNSYRVGVFQGITTTGVPSVANAFTAGQKNTCVDAVWTVNYNGAGSPSTTMRVEWPLSLEGTKFQGFSTIGIAHYGPSWGIPAGSGAHGSPNFATLAGITTFSPFGVGNPAYQVLATKITYFNAAKGNGYNTVNWQAACSSSQVTFEVLRSTDGRNFTSINSLTASQARCAQPFNFQDNTAPQGIVYYRLKVIDIDGKETLSAIVKLSSEIKDMELTGVSPNPVSNIAQLKINASKADMINLTVISTEGQVVYRNSVQLQPGSSVVNLDIAKLPAGIYMIKGMFSDGVTNTVKFMKQ